MEEFKALDIWDEKGEDKSCLDLAMDKRMKIEMRIKQMEEEELMAGKDGADEADDKKI